MRYTEDMTTDLRIATNTQRAQKADIEGPTAKQAVRMATRRSALLALGTFEGDCDAWDIERDLVAYGFDIDTGRRS